MRTLAFQEPLDLTPAPTHHSTKPHAPKRPAVASPKAKASKRKENPTSDLERQLAPPLSSAPALAPTRSPETPESASSTPVASLSDQDIQQVISAGRPEIAGCFETHRQDLPSEEGRVTVRFTILRSGALESPSVSGDLRNTAAGNCIEARMRTFRFPRSRESVSLETSFGYRAKR